MSEAARLQREIDALRSSTSWRLTAPLRAAVRLLRGARNATREPEAASPAKPTSTSCRLCGGTTRERFRRQVLLKHDVGYQECTACGSVQTEPPYWLDEAYAIPGVHIDVGIATRTLQCWVSLVSFLDHVGFSRDLPALDFGSATGLLPRLMRDIGFNFHASDKYATPQFVNYFIDDDLQQFKPKLITAFEVLEHFPEPAASLDELFAADADMLILSTWLVDGNGDEWRYFVPECGQHVFFYSEKGLRDFAAERDYDLLLMPHFHLLAKRGRVSDETKARIDSFSAASKELYDRTWARLLTEVSSDSPHIARDFAFADQKFREALSQCGQAA